MWQDKQSFAYLHGKQIGYYSQVFSICLYNFSKLLSNSHQNSANLMTWKRKIVEPIQPQVNWHLDRQGKPFVNHGSFDAQASTINIKIFSQADA